jgi:hypothetical protein
MPVLNYHRDEKDMPDMSKKQQCDMCGIVQIGNQMYYSYPSGDKIRVVCRSCFAEYFSSPPGTERAFAQRAPGKRQA